jgi:hypothetical protein
VLAWQRSPRAVPSLLRCLLRRVCCRLTAADVGASCRTLWALQALHSRRLRSPRSVVLLQVTFSRCARARSHPPSPTRRRTWRRFSRSCRETLQRSSLKTWPRSSTVPLLHRQQWPSLRMERHLFPLGERLRSLVPHIVQLGKPPLLPLAGHSSLLPPARGTCSMSPSGYSLGTHDPPHHPSHLRCAWMQRFSPPVRECHKHYRGALLPLVRPLATVPSPTAVRSNRRT